MSAYETAIQEQKDPAVLREELLRWRQRAYERDVRVTELTRAIDKLARENEIRRHAVDRWVPCHDHRDKVEPGRCLACKVERLERLMLHIVEVYNSRATLCMRDAEAAFEMADAAWRAIPPGNRPARPMLPPERVPIWRRLFKRWFRT